MDCLQQHGGNDNLAFARNEVGQFVWKYTGTFGTCPSTRPGTDVASGPAYLLYATLAGPSNPPAAPLPTATVTMHLAYTYGNADRRTGLTLPDGKSQSWGYDAAGRVNSLTQAGSSPNTYTVSHNGAGDITTLMAPNGGEQTWSYDGAGRITGTTWLTGTTTLFTQTVTLDAAGQRAALPVWSPIPTSHHLPSHGGREAGHPPDAYATRLASSGDVTL